MRPTESLKNACLSDWNAATDHAFCRELAAGTLPRAKMVWYLAQDYKFIDNFVRLLARAVSEAPSLPDRVPGAQFLALVTGPENTYFLRSFEALNMSEAEINAPTAPVTADFLDLMAEARDSGNYAQMLAVLTVAEWSYLTWGERYVGYAEGLPFYFSEWIDLHSGDYFASVIAYLRDQLDGIWDSLSETEQAQTADMFTRAVACEKAFFDAAYAA